MMDLKGTPGKTWGVSKLVGGPNDQWLEIPKFHSIGKLHQFLRGGYYQWSLGRFENLRSLCAFKDLFYFHPETWGRFSHCCAHVDF